MSKAVSAFCKISIYHLDLDIVPVKKQDTLAGLAAFERSLDGENREGVVCCLEPLHENNDKPTKSSNECRKFPFFFGMMRILCMQNVNIFFSPSSSL